MFLYERLAVICQYGFTGHVMHVDSLHKVAVASTVLPMQSLLKVLINIHIELYTCIGTEQLWEPLL